MVRSSCACKNRPTVVMPVDYKMCISGETNYGCDEKGRYRGRILYKQPARGLRAVAQGVEETPHLPEDFEGPCEDEGEGFRAEEEW